MASEAGSYTPETIARRQALADALLKSSNRQKPMTHWMEGVGDLGEKFAAGMLEKRNRDQQKEGNAKIAEMLLGMNAPNAGLTTLQGSNPIPEGVTPFVPQSSGPGKVYANDEPSPLDPPSGKDRDLAVRTIYAEAGNEAPVGQQAVANVIRNRAVSGNYGGDTPSGVVTARNQFEPWNTEAGRGKMAALDPNSPKYQQIAAALERAYTGDDPTNGAVNFFSPKAQAALGRNIPSWGREGGQDIGNHRFFGGAPQQPGPALAFNGQPSDLAALPPASAAAPPPSSQPPLAAPQPAMPSPAPSQAVPQQPPVNAQTQKIAEMLRSDNPYVQRMGAQLAQGVIQQQFSQSKPTFGVIGEDEFQRKKYGWIDQQKQSVTPYGEPTTATAGTPAPGATAAAPLAIPPPPPGADPKKWRETFTENAAKSASAQPEKDKAAKSVADVVVADIDRALTTMDEATLPTTGAVGSVLSRIGNTAAHDVSKLMDTVKANAGFQELAKMRAASPTGAALGAISDRETALLQATIGNLEQSQSEQQFRDNLKRVKNTYLDIIHGPGKGPERAGLAYKGETGGPKAGTVEGGYRFKGGNPADKNNWEKAS